MADEAESPPSTAAESVIRVAADDLQDASSTTYPDVGPKSPKKKRAKAPQGQRSTSGHGKEEGGGAAAHGSDDGSQTTSSKCKSRPASKPAPAKKPRPTLAALRKSAKDRKWQAPFVYTDEKSPLALADLRGILLHPEAWEVLTEEEKRDVLAKFPDETRILNAGTSDARPNTVSLRNDNNFRHDCVRYCENLKAGRHDEEWLSQAWIAHEKHKRGDFDAFLREQFEEDWGIKLPDDSQPGHEKEDDQSEAHLSEPLHLNANESAAATESHQGPTPSTALQQTSSSPQAINTDPSSQISTSRGDGAGLDQEPDTKQISQSMVSSSTAQTQHLDDPPGPEHDNLAGPSQSQDQGHCIVVSQLA
ncbi:hypothetical protein VTK26DRAFT_4999 [Humicola hyalothermophila]